MPILSLGLLLRLLLMPFTIQSDIVFASWVASFVVRGHWNVYSYYFQKYGTIWFPPNSPAGQGMLAVGWPPLFYMIDAGYLNVLKMLDVFPFLTQWGIHAVDWSGIWNIPFPFRDWFFFKLLYVPFDLLSLIFLVKLVDDSRKRTVAVLWFLSPVLLYATYMWGQMDLLIAFSFCLALFYAKKSMTRKCLGSAIISELFLGFGAAFKIFPIFLVPVMAAFLGRRKPLRLCLLLLSGVVVPALTVLPFLSRPFLETMLVLGGIPRVTLVLVGVTLSGSYTIYLFLGAYFALLLYLYLKERFLTFDRLVFYGLAANALFFALTPFHPQWFLWALPFLVLTASRGKRAFIVYTAILACYFMVPQLYGNSLMIGLFSPLSPQLAAFPGLKDLLPGFNVLFGITFGLFEAGLLLMCYLQLRCEVTKFAVPIGRAIVMLLIPVLYGVVNLLLGYSYLLQHGTAVMSTLTGAIESDPAFFYIYIVITIAALAEAVWSIVPKRPLRLAGSGVLQSER
jgi:hypothetical protein